MAYKASKKLVNLLKKAHEGTPATLFESIKALIEAMRLIKEESKEKEAK